MTPAALPETQDDAVDGSYFDGQTSRPYRVRLTVRGGVARLDGEAQRECTLDQLRVSERSRHAVRKVTFPDGAYLEVRDAAGLQRLLQRTGHREGWVVRLQQSWRAALLACGATVLALAAGYVWLLPAAAGWIARLVPLNVERQLGAGALKALDGPIFLPSHLPAQRQAELTQAFGRLQPPDGEASSWHLLFRRSRIGPNAFALPSGEIVLTDEMVALLQDDQAVLGVLAHELGHLQQRHLLRRLIQGTAVGAATTLLFGDASTLLASLPALALDMKYSRDAEREADDYAIAMLQRNGIALDHLARVFERLERQASQQAPRGEELSYLSSHPASAERIARIRAAQR
jgi:Zn-dependent protease with chaperone function